MPKKAQKDPERVANAYKGLMKKQTTSPKWKLIPEDYQKWARDIFIFFIPAMIVALTVLQNAGSFREAMIAFWTWVISALINLLQKLASEKTYIE